MLAEPSQPSQRRKGPLMTVKEQIDIEALLYRAYAQYRVDRVTPQAVLGLPRVKPSGSLVGAMSALQLGTVVDNSGVAARMLGAQSMAAATPDDMLVVHDHVLALADWLIEEARSDEPRVWRRDEIDANGWRIEDTAQGTWLVRPGEGAKGGDAWSLLTNPYLSVLVIEHGRAGTRPDHGEQPKAGRGRPDAAALRERGDAMLSRALYAAWHACLRVLAAELDDVLLRHAVTGPIAPPAPWDRAGEGRLIDACPTEGLKQGNSTTHNPLKSQGNHLL